MVREKVKKKEKKKKKEKLSYGYKLGGARNGIFQLDGWRSETTKD